MAQVSEPLLTATMNMTRKCDVFSTFIVALLWQMGYCILVSARDRFILNDKVSISERAIQNTSLMKSELVYIHWKSKLRSKENLGGKD